MPRVFVGLGSNVGDRLSFVKDALLRLQALPDTIVERVSSVYETEPVGLREQPLFLNAVVECLTVRSPREFIHDLKSIEQQVGRTQHMRWGPREIDLDLLFYDALVMEEDGVQIPHAEVERRRFVLEPLNELAPEFIDPRTHRTMKELLQATFDRSLVTKTSIRLER
jgi:2-amino-4-hydroxy-6-hydroxymethyldihydropteridine diphosphokinase